MLEIIDSEDERIIRINDELFSNIIIKLEDSVNNFIKDDKRNVLIDLDSVTKIDSMSLATLIRMKQKLNEKDRELYLTNPNPGVMRVLELAGFDDFLLD